MRKNFRRVAALTAVITAGGLLGGAALALPGGINVGTAGDGGPTTGGQPPIVRQAQKTANNVVAFASDKALGLGGGGGIGPLPGPTPGLHPIDTVNGGIQTVASRLGDAALGLGGTHIGPLPAPTPGLHPENTANQAIQTGASTLYKASKVVGSIHVDDPTGSGTHTGGGGPH